MHALRILTHGWHVPPRTPDYIGILMPATIPALACLVVCGEAHNKAHKTLDLG